MEKDIDVSEYSGGTKIVLHQLYNLFGGENPGIITNSTLPNSTHESNTLASLLEQYSRSINEGGGIGYIGLEWKGPFSFHPDILQHSKRMTSLTGSVPSMNCGTLHHLNHGYITLENLLYIFPLTEQDDATNSAIRGHDTFKEDEIKRISKPLSITLPLAIKAVAVTFPKFGMFSEKVQFILCVLTEKSAHLYGICYEKKIDHNRSQIPKYELVTTPLNREGIDESLTIQCSLPYHNNSLEFLSLHGTLDGRFFFLLRSDCNIYEIVYQSKEGWITPYCYIYTHQVHSSMLKRILFRYTILRFLPLSQPLTLVSFAPCGYIITMDIHQNLYLLTYSSNLKRDCLLNKISPWGRMINSLGYWLPKSESNLYVPPTQWDNFLNSQIKEDIYSKSNEIRSKSIDFESNNPAKIKILAVLSKQQLNYILEGNNVKESLEDNQRNNERFLISNIDLSFSADYHLILTVFMKCGTRLLFRCSCNEDEVSSFTYTQIKNSKKSVISPKRQAESSNPSIFDQFKPRYKTSSIIFGFWLTDILNNSDTKVVIQSAYYKNGLTIISYPLNSINKEKQSKSLESTMNNINNQYQIEIRLLSSVPADLTTSHKFNSLGIQNSGSRLRYSKYSNNLDPNSDIGEPIVLGVNEPIIDIYEVPTDLYNKMYQDSGGITNEINSNIPNINPSILLEYGGIHYGPKASYDLLGWCKDRYIILMGYTHYYSLTIRWNGLQQAFGSTGLFMQIIQEVKQGTNFRRLVHPEDSYLSFCNSYLTSPWIEAITGALAFSLRSTLEMPILISMNKVSCTFTIKTLDHCIYTLQNMIHFLSRSQNIIGTELFNIWNPPKSSFTKPKYFFEVMEEVFTCQIPLKMIEITTNILKSITFIIHMLLQLFRLLYYYQESPLNIRDEVVQKMKNERALDIILKTPTLFLVTSNDHINCLKKFSSCFINSLVISMIESKRENTTTFNNKLSTIQKSIHWLLCPKTRKFLTRSILSFELGFYNSKYSHSSINSANSILEKFLHLANPSMDSTNPSVSQKYWLDFLKDPTRHELLENAFCTLTVEPHNKFYDATILLIELIQFFDKEIKGNRNNFEINSLNMTSQLNIPQYVNLLVKSWDFSMCDALIEFIENKLSNNEDEIVGFACKVISECLKAMTSLKIGLEIFCIFLKHLLNSFLMKLFNNLKYLVFRKHGICLCNFLMKDLAYILRYSCNNILPDHSNKGVLSIITNSFIIGIDGNSANESYIETICSISLELAIQSKYSPFYLLAAIFNLYNSRNKTMAYNNIASILCALGLNNEISCQVKCFNPFTSLELLDIVQYIMKNKISKVIEDTDIQNIFTLLPDKKSPLNKSYLNLEDMYIVLTEIINSLEYLQLPVLNYINSITNNTGDYDYVCDFSNEGLKRIDDIQVLPIEYVQYYLKNNIVQSYSEMLSIIYRCPHIQLFSIIASLLESTTIIRTEENVDAFCSLLSDMLLQTLLPPKSHPIYQLVSDYDTIFPILETMFGFNGDNLLDSFLKLLVYIEKPLIGINGTELLDSLALMKTINKQKDVNLQTIYIFQQLYVLLAVLEFSIHYFKTKKALYKRIYPDELNTISIKIWKNKWNVSYHLLLDTYVSLIEACCTTNISNNPFSLIVDRLISLGCPLVTVNIADTFEDFVQHLRLCATTVIIIWVKEDLQDISSNQKDIIVNFISTVIPFLSVNTNKILANHEALINTLQDITLKLSNNKKSC
ncbi:hypothetical protein cand_001690 [Cryptosporidium andersoni]|uniref:Uncharacterized protein n=1 Tax=Cryptosporidium andersoni TaxID=117008 RepID=A0A1J4MQM4_9CRYT|nr:hypothetical protein cand_001690 [Cryptosporidium andersoni]